MNGVLIIDKPTGLTSHDVVNRVRRLLNQRSVGHLGTLDPMATGVLPLVVGSFTRLAQFYLNAEKSYEGTIRFGFSTDTYDAEGEPTSAATNVNLQKEELDALTSKFHGVIEQVPPPFSAKKIKGVPAYKLARKQKEVVLDPVQVEIKEFAILSVMRDHAQFRARVASGTYMRSVAHDMGQVLGCGAHLESLRRTAVAEFTLQDAHALEEVATAGKSSSEGVLSRDNTDEGEEAAEEFFVHPRKLLPHLPCVTADPTAAARIRSGQAVNLLDVSRAGQVKVFTSQRELIAIATRIAGTLFHAKIVLCSTDKAVHGP